MPRITAEELLERRISELKGAEFEKKKDPEGAQKKPEGFRGSYRSFTERK